MAGTIEFRRQTSIYKKTKYTDNFNLYTNGGLGGQGNWVLSATTDITVNNSQIQQQIGAPGAQTSRVYYNQSLENNQYSQLTIVSNPMTGGDGTINSIGVAVRMNASGHGYLFLVSHEDMVLTKYTGQYSPNLDTSSSFVEAGDVIKIEAIGTSIKAYVNGQEVFSVTDSDISSGYAGLCGWGGYRYPPFITADDWEGGDL